MLERGASSTAESLMVEVPYEEADLRDLKKKDLVAMVRRQLTKWPTEGKFNESKTTVPAIKAALLDSANGFTKTVRAASQTLAGATVEERADQRPEIGVVGPGEASGGAPEAPLASYHDGGDGASTTHDVASLSPFGDGGDVGDHTQGRPASPEREVHQVRVYIDDMRGAQRGTQDVLRTATTIPLSLVDRHNCAADEWRASTRELLRNLQQTAAAILGPVRLSFPDKLFPAYNVCFVKTRAGQALESADPDMDLLVLPDSDAFQLVVEQVTVGFENTPETVIGPSNTAPLAPILPVAGPSTAPRSNKRQNIADAHVAWLSDRAKERAGYDAFKKGQHRVQCNADVVASWRFAVEFAEQYNKKPLSHIGPTAVTKNVIQQALGVGSTWLSEAENAIHIIRMHGEGGLNPWHAVIEAVASRVEKPEGRKALYRFLKEQE